MIQSVDLEKLHTVQLVPITAFDAQGRLNLEPMRGLTRRLFDAGIRCFIPCAGSAEFHGLTRALGVDSSDPDLATVRDRTRNRDKTMAIHRQVRENATRMSIDEGAARLEENQVPFGIVREVHGGRR